MTRDSMKRREVAKVMRALRASGLPLAFIARRAGLTTSALRRYRDGSRAMPPELPTRLAAVLLDQSATLARLARELSP